LRAATLILPAASFVAGCTSLQLKPDPEIAPSRTAHEVWIPPRSVSGVSNGRPGLQQLRHFDVNAPLPPSGTQIYDLPALVDLALKINPQTRRAWYGALAAHAGLGQSLAINFPKAGADVQASYFKLPLQFPGQTLIIDNEAFLPQFKVSYELLDFGRSRAAQRGAREQLIGANFAFDRTIQDVVFEVEKAYYMLSAANASVTAAEANLKLARTSLDAIQQRHRVGLATRPQILLAKQVEAQAVYDLENAKSMVHDAEAALCLAVGVAAGAPIDIRRGELDHLPQTLSDDIEKLMTNALERRPDLAAQVAAVHAGDAAIAGAESQYYPEVEIGGNYGQDIWSYTVNGGNSQNLNQPFYGTLMTLRWNLFTGFDRYYGVKKATAERDAAREQLKTLQLSAITEVWKAYYDFRSASKKQGASEALVTASQESYDANFESHRRGLATITDLITAERDLMASRFTLIQSKADLLISSSALVHAVGAESASKVR